MGLPGSRRRAVPHGGVRPGQSRAQRRPRLPRPRLLDRPVHLAGRPARAWSPRAAPLPGRRQPARPPMPWTGTPSCSATPTSAATPAVSCTTRAPGGCSPGATPTARAASSASSATPSPDRRPELLPVARGRPLVPGRAGSSSRSQTARSRRSLSPPARSTASTSTASRVATTTSRRSGSAGPAPRPVPRIRRAAVPAAGCSAPSRRRCRRGPRWRAGAGAA